MIDAAWQLDIGATVLASKRVRFRVWAPRATTVKVQVFGGGNTRSLPLTEEQWGYFVGEEEVGEDDRYIFQLDEGTGYPDPASRFQPEGVHGPSQIVNPAAFTWQDNAWKGLPIDSVRRLTKLRNWFSRFI